MKKFAPRHCHIRNTVRRFRPPLQSAKGEEGFVLVTSMLVLLILVIIGISATTNTTIELHIAGNEKLSRQVFYLADSGINIAPHLVSTGVDDGSPPSGADLGTIRYVAGDGGTSFYRQIMGFDSYNGGKIHPAAREFAHNIAGNSGSGITLDVERGKVQHKAGGGVEFATGAEGIGTGSNGGAVIHYRIESFGSGPRNTATSVEAGYRKVAGLAGGK